MSSGRPSVARRVLSSPTGYLPAIWLMLIAVAAVFGSWLAPHDPNGANFDALFRGPGSEFLLGTDDLGRDVLSRLIFAARVALLASLQAVGIGVVVGVPIGLFVGYRGGWWDRIVMRLVDVLFSLPSLVLAFTVVALLGSGITNAMIAVGVLFAIRFIRLTRGVVLSVREEPYVEAARFSGAPVRQILARYLLPNIAGPLIVQASLSFAAALLVEASLSFLGLGVEQPDATWGSMLRDARTFQSKNAWLAWPPGLAITFTVLAFNTLGDRLRDVLAEPAIAGPRDPESPRDPHVSVHVDQVSRRDDAREVVLEVRSLHVDVVGVSTRAAAVQGLSFDLYQGEVLGLVGESGSGKTLAARAIAGLLPRGVELGRASSLRYRGQEMTTMDEPTRRRLRGAEIAMVFQDPMSSLNPSLTVGRQLAEPLRQHRAMDRRSARIRSAELLDLVGVPDAGKRLDDYPHQFSGGMAQRVMIAMALAGEPSILIADEPTTALDVTRQRQVLDLLLATCRELGVAVLFITHDLGVVAEVCDRVVVMYASQAVEVAHVDRLFAEPMHPYTKALLGSIPRIDHEQERLVSLPGSVPSVFERLSGCRFEPRCTLAQDVCRRSAPVLEPCAGGHLVRCPVALDGRQQVAP